MQEIGLFCGTFNPIHMGHLLVAECARVQFELSKVLFVTSAKPPHRSDVLLPGEERHQMVLRAIADNPFFEASTKEIERAGPSYTIDTINLYKLELGESARINILIGGDNVIHLRSWQKVEEIFKNARLLIAPRFSEGQANADLPTPGINVVEFEARERFTLERPTASLSDLERQVLKGANYEIIDFPFLEISSSSIRKRVSEGKSVLYMVPQSVNQFILEQGFYTTEPSDHAPPNDEVSKP